MLAADAVVAVAVVVAAAAVPEWTEMWMGAGTFFDEAGSGAES